MIAWRGSPPPVSASWPAARASISALTDLVRGGPGVRLVRVASASATTAAIATSLPTMTGHGVVADGFARWPALAIGTPGCAANGGVTCLRVFLVSSTTGGVASAARASRIPSVLAHQGKYGR